MEENKCASTGLPAIRIGTPPPSKTDVARIRHVFLDFDHNGNAAVQALFQRKDLPVPSYVLNTSPGKWQVVWNWSGTRGAPPIMSPGIRSSSVASSFGGSRKASWPSDGLTCRFRTNFTELLPESLAILQLVFGTRKSHQARDPH
jgi:hypothetical protein